MLAKVVVILIFTAEALQIVHLDFLVTLATGVIAYLPMLFAALFILGIGLYLGQLIERVLQNIVKHNNSRTLGSYSEIYDLRHYCVHGVRSTRCCPFHC